MDPIEEISRAQAAELVDEDGRPVTLELAPGLTPREIEALEAEAGVALAGELRRLLAHTAGIDGALDLIDFTGRSLDVALDETFPSGLPIAGDGFGNFWVADLAPAGDRAKVFFACHDPPVVLYQGPSVAHFLHETFRMYVAPHRSLVDDVHEDRIHNVWGTNPGVIARAQALASEDEALRAFAAALQHDDFEIVDLRDAEIGMGFSWGRHGPRTELRRHGDELLFALRPPPHRPRSRRGLFRRR